MWKDLDHWLIFLDLKGKDVFLLYFKKWKDEKKIGIQLYICLTFEVI